MKKIRKNKEKIFRKNVKKSQEFIGIFLPKNRVIWQKNIGEKIEKIFRICCKKKVSKVFQKIIGKNNAKNMHNGKNIALK